MPRKRDISEGDTAKLECTVTRAFNDSDLITVRIKGYDYPITIDQKWLVNHVRGARGRTFRFVRRRLADRCREPYAEIVPSQQRGS